MKKYLILLFLSCFFLSAQCYSFPDPFQDYVIEYAKYISIFKNKENSIWPGLQIEKHPVILIYPEGVWPETDMYAFNFQTTNPLWQRQVISGEIVYHTPNDQFGVNAFQPTLENPYFILDNQSVMIGKFFPIYTVTNIENIISNYFFLHEIQGTSSAKSKIEILRQAAKVAYNDFNNKQNIAWQILELEALKDYLKTNDENALKNYVAIFQTRYAGLDEASRLYEVTSNELFPLKYVYLKGASTDDKDLAAKIVDIYPYYDGAVCSGDLGMHDDMSLNAIITAVSYGLDHTTPGWQARLENDNIPASLILAKHYPMDSNEIAKRVQDAKAKYNMAYYWNSLSQSCDPYFNNMQSATQQYDQDPGVEITFALNTLGSNWSFTVSGDTTSYEINNHLYFIQNGLTGYVDGTNGAIVNVKSHYATLEPCSQDIFKMKNLCERKTTFKILPQTKFIIDNKEMTAVKILANNTNIVFHNLSFKTDETQNPITVNLDSATQSYLLNVDHGKITVKLAN